VRTGDSANSYVSGRAADQDRRYPLRLQTPPRQTESLVEEHPKALSEVMEPWEMNDITLELHYFQSDSGIFFSCLYSKQCS
jgi:hypothetical protein